MSQIVSTKPCIIEVETGAKLLEVIQCLVEEKRWKQLTQNPPMFMAVADIERIRVLYQHTPSAFMMAHKNRKDMANLVQKGSPSTSWCFKVQVNLIFHRLILFVESADLQILRVTCHMNSYFSFCAPQLPAAIQRREKFEKLAVTLPKFVEALKARLALLKEKQALIDDLEKQWLGTMGMNMDLNIFRSCFRLDNMTEVRKCVEKTKETLARPGYRIQQLSTPYYISNKHFTPNTFQEVDWSDPPRVLGVWNWQGRTFVVTENYGCVEITARAMNNDEDWRAKIPLGVVYFVQYKDQLNDLACKDVTKASPAFADILRQGLDMQVEKLQNTERLLHGFINTATPDNWYIQVATYDIDSKRVPVLPPLGPQFLSEFAVFPSESLQNTSDAIQPDIWVQFNTEGVLVIQGTTPKPNQHIELVVKRIKDRKSGELDPIFTAGIESNKQNRFEYRYVNWPVDEWGSVSFSLRAPETGHSNVVVLFERNQGNEIRAMDYAWNRESPLFESLRKRSIIFKG